MAAVPSSVETLTVDCAHPEELARFWAAALDYEIGEVGEEGGRIAAPSGHGWPVLFIVVPEGKSAKNRLHLDLRPPLSMAAEVERLKTLGATEQRVVKEGGSFWTVMQDPEGNEFCVLRGPEDGWSPP
ncbi:MAG TPA: VOC family protein [Actinomycetota bacterium]|nr:VOC family protein [Actinomycetota bacterium]